MTMRDEIFTTLETQQFSHHKHVILSDDGSLVLLVLPINAWLEGGVTHIQLDLESAYIALSAGDAMAAIDELVDDLYDIKAALDDLSGIRFFELCLSATSDLSDPVRHDVKLVKVTFKHH